MKASKWKYNIFTFILFFFIWLQLPAQEKEFRFGKINSSNPISSNYVSNIIQDKHGFIWFATNDGLNRYDGYCYRIYHCNLTGTGSIRETVIRRLLTDKKGNLWVLGDNFNIYNEDTDAFIQFSNPFNDPIINAFEDFKGNFWFFGYHTTNLIQFDVEKNKIADAGNKYSFLKDKYLTICGVDKKDHLWIFSYPDIYKIDLQSFYSGKTEYKSYRIEKFNSSFFELSDDKILLGNDQNGGWYEYSYDADSIYCLKGNEALIDIKKNAGINLTHIAAKRAEKC